jgi:hypothetical protein
LFKGTVTINNGGTWDFSGGNDAVELQNGLTNNGAFTSGTGTYSFTTTATQSLSGSSATTFDGNISIGTNVALTNTLNVGGTGLTVNGNLNGNSSTTSVFKNEGIFDIFSIINSNAHGLRTF